MNKIDEFINILEVLDLGNDTTKRKIVKKIDTLIQKKENEINEVPLAVLQIVWNQIHKEITNLRKIRQAIIDCL